MKISHAPLTAGVDKSGTITAGGASQQLAAANTARLALTIQNISGGDLGINEMGGTAAIGTAGTYTLPAGASAEVHTNRLVNIIGATTGQAFTATEF